MKAIGCSSPHPNIPFPGKKALAEKPRQGGLIFIKNFYARVKPYSSAFFDKALIELIVLISCQALIKVTNFVKDLPLEETIRDRIGIVPAGFQSILGISNAKFMG